MSVNSPIFRWSFDAEFENSQEIEHVKHAFEQLAAGGRLVSVMSVGPFFRTDKKAEQFRAWLDDLDYETEDLPEDAFQGVEAFRQTGVRTKLLLLTKPNNESAIS